MTAEHESDVLGGGDPCAGPAGREEPAGTPVEEAIVTALPEATAEDLAESEGRMKQAALFDLLDSFAPEAIARLAHGLRDNLDDRAVAARLLSTLWLREADRPLSRTFGADSADITRDGKWIASLIQTEGIQIQEVETGEAVMEGWIKPEGSHYCGISISSPALSGWRTFRSAKCFTWLPPL